MGAKNLIALLWAQFEL